MDPVKPFLPYSDQLDLVKKRGLIVHSDSSALSILQSENYYRLSGYWLSRYNRNTETFLPDTTLSEIMDYYSFDSDFRSVILRYSSIVEVNLRSYIAYYHSEKYGPIGYLDCTNFTDSSYHSDFLSKLQKEINRKRDQIFVKHHVQDKGSIFPLWAAVELLSFDELSKLYKNMLSVDRGQIARLFYNIPSRKYIENWIMTAVLLRNKAAHCARFYNTKSSHPVKLPPSLSAHVRTIFGQIYALYYLLKPEDQQPFLTDIKLCFFNHRFVDSSLLGFPSDWLSELK